MIFSSTTLSNNTLMQHLRIRVGRGIQAFARLALTLVVFGC